MTTSTAAPLTGVEETLDRMARTLPTEVASARAALTVVQTRLATTCWPELGDRFSLLTNTGLPVELAWASADDAVRWTAEVAPPEVPDQDRAGAAAALAAELTDVRIDVSPWRSLQTGRPLRYGAWLGLRHRASTRAAKIYLEVPGVRAGGLPLGPEAVGALRRCERLLGEVHWRMAGLSHDATVEVYARAPQLHGDDLALVAGLLPDGDALVAAVTALLPVPGLPRPSGFSVTFAPSGGVVAMTWFCFAKAIWRDDVATATALRRLTASDGSGRLYDALVAAPPDGRWRHSMVGAGCDREGRTWVQAGLRPG